MNERVRAHAWVAGQVPSRGRTGGSHTLKGQVGFSKQGGMHKTSDLVRASAQTEAGKQKAFVIYTIKG